MPLATLDDFSDMLPASTRYNHTPDDESAASGGGGGGGVVQAAWHGTISVLEREFRLCVIVRQPPLPSSDAPAGPSLDTLLAEDTDRVASSLALPLPPPPTIAIDGEPELADLLATHQATLTTLWNQQPDVNSFLLEFKDLMTRILRASASGGIGGLDSNAASAAYSGIMASLSPPPSSSFFEALANDIAQLEGGWTCVKNMSERTPREFTLRVVDEAAREHLMEVTLPKLYPLEPPLVTVSLPVPFDLTLPSSCVSGSTSSSTPSVLSVLFSRFTAAVASFQTFWNALDDLDAHAWILEPEQPIARSACLRRLAIEKSCSLEVVLDPLRPLAIPSLRLLGDERVCTPLHTVLMNQLAAGEWQIPSSSNSSPPPPVDHLRSNLLRVLGLAGVDEDGFPLALPLATERNRDEFNLECPICTSYKLEDAVPDVVCANTRCARSFHRACLLEWLASVSTTTDSFGSLHGACPQCFNKIVVRK